MAKFMDVHSGFFGVSAEQLAEAHGRDLAIEAERGRPFRARLAGPGRRQGLLPGDRSVPRVRAADPRAGRPPDARDLRAPDRGVTMQRQDGVDRGAVLSATILAGQPGSCPAAAATRPDGGDRLGTCFAAAIGPPPDSTFHGPGRRTPATVRPRTGADSMSASASFDGRARWASTARSRHLLDTTLDPTKPRGPRLRARPTGRPASRRARVRRLPGGLVRRPTASRRRCCSGRCSWRPAIDSSEIPNRYEIPAVLSLHVWLWKFNPSGLFAPFNPNVSCDPGNRVHDHASTGSLVADRMRPVRRRGSPSTAPSVRA